MLNLVERCCLFFCLPLTESEFAADKDNPTKDFTYNFVRDLRCSRSWLDYEQQVSIPFTEWSTYFGHAGIMIINNGTYSDFIRIIHSKIADVIILLSHCRDGGIPTMEAIEFYDRMVLSTEILSEKFPNYPLVLDISVCSPKHLSYQMQTLHPGFACFSSKEEKELSIWLYIYGLIFQTMHNQGVGFQFAYLQTLKKINI